MNQLIKTGYELLNNVDSIIGRLSIERFFQSLVGHESSQQLNRSELDQLYAALFFTTGLLDELPVDDPELEKVLSRIAETFDDLSILKTEPFVTDSLSMSAYAAIDYAAIDKSANASVLVKSDARLSSTAWQSLEDKYSIYRWLVYCMLLATASDFAKLNKFSQISLYRDKIQALLDKSKDDYQEITASILLIDTLHSFSTYMINGQLENYEKALSRLKEADEIAKVSSLLCEIVFYLNSLFPRIAQNQSSTVLEKLNSSLPQEYLNVLLNSRSAIYQLWPSQTKALQHGLLKYDTFSISLPTSAGKTFLAELKTASAISSTENTLAFYVVPLNALAKQVKRDLEVRLRRAPLNLFIKVLTGAYEIGDEEFELVGRQENVIITTPEKLDGLLRNLDNPQISSLFDRCRLFIFDECHNIGEGNRGITYEVLISRLLDIFPNNKVLALSAVFENIDDMARWIGKDDFSFLKDDWRPTSHHWAIWPGPEEKVPDKDKPGESRQKGLVYDNQWEITGYTRTKSVKSDLARIALDLQRAYENVLILANRRDIAESYAYYIAQNISESDNKLLTGEDLKYLKQLADQIRRRIHPSSRLAQIVENGVAYHHAHLPSDLKSRIEDYIANGILKIVVSTTTLGQGLNFPIRCVIIPSIYISGKAMSPLQIKNIIGRAGRARVSTSGLAVIFKSSDWVRYENRWIPFDKYCIDPPPDTLKVKSSLSSLQTQNSTIDYYEALEAFDSQILAFLGQSGLDIENQANYIVDRTFLSTYAPDMVAPITEVLRNRMDSMTQGTNPLLRQGSPFALTAYGNAVRKIGYGASNANLLRDAIENTLNQDKDFFTSIRNGSDLTRSKVKEFFLLGYAPIDNLLRSFALQQKIKKTFGISMSKVRQDIEAFITELKNNQGAKETIRMIIEQGDSELLWLWINGADHEELSNFFAEENREDSSRLDEHITESIHFVEEISRVFSWASYAILNILQHLIEEKGISTYSRELSNIPLYIKYGVNHPVALFIQEKLKWQNRKEALQISNGLPGEFSYFDDREQLIHMIQAMGESGISDRINNPLNAHEIWLRLVG